MFRVVPQFDLSLNDLLRLHGNGYFVRRSCHVGNQYLSNMLLATVGLSALVYDRNTLQQDFNYHPGQKISQGAIEDLTQISSGIASSVAPISQVHMRPLHARFPGLFHTEAEYFLAHREMVEKWFGIVAKHAPYLFDRYLCECGFVHKLQWMGTSAHGSVCCGYGPVRASQLVDLAMEFIYKLSLAHRGEVQEVIVGPIWSLQLHLVLETLMNLADTGRSTVYQLSGPDMVSYVTGVVWQAKLAQVWRVFQHSDTLTPEQVDVKVVPTAHVRFAYKQGHEQGRVVIEGTLAMERYRQDRKAPERLQFQRQVRELLPEWNIFYDISNPVSWPYSQHHNAPLVVPEEIMGYTMEELQGIWNRSRERFKPKR